MSSALQLDRIAKLYGRTAALRAVSLRLEPGETLALLGPNGSGKTTLLKIVAGAIAPTLGSGSIFGHDLQRERQTLRSVVGLLSSDTYLYDDLSAQENLRFFLTMAGRQPRDGEIMTALHEVNLAGQAGERTRTFSSGMKRRLSLARVLLLQPKLLLLDEPYNSLDAEGADLIDAVIQRQVATGGAAVLATHDAERALGLAQRVAALENGGLSYAGAAAGWKGRRAQHVG